jgi:hypothetical protein
METDRPRSLRWDQQRSMSGEVVACETPGFAKAGGMADAVGLQPGNGPHRPLPEHSRAPNNYGHVSNRAISLGVL